MSILKEHFTLSNGVTIPKIGFGTWQIPAGEVCHQSVTFALKAGYRHIDTAAAYRNEKSCAQAIRDFGLSREEVFVTSKLQSHIKTYEETMIAFQKTLDELGFDYLDLYLIHAPWPWNEMGKDCKKGNIEAYKAMEKLYLDGKIRAIGVSNFNVDDLQNILDHCHIVPHVNQISFFIGNRQQEIYDFCKEKNIFIEAYSPLAIGYLLDNPDVIKMASKYEKTPAQISIRYCIEKGTLPLPKSTKEHRIIENSKVDFVLDKKDLDFLDTIVDDPRKW